MRVVEEAVGDVVALACALDVGLVEGGLFVGQGGSGSRSHVEAWEKMSEEDTVVEEQVMMCDWRSSADSMHSCDLCSVLV